MKLELNEFCPCCGYDTFDSKERLNYGICRICFWEDDPDQFKFIHDKGSNRVSLVQARENFKKFGACELKMKSHTRNITPMDKRDPNYFI